VTRPNFVLLDATHRVLAEHGGAKPGEVYRHLLARGYAVERTSVTSPSGYIAQLQAQGILDSNRKSLIAPLYPAYLLIDLADPVRRTELSAKLSAHDRAIEAMARAGNPRAKKYEQLPLFLVRKGSAVEDLQGTPNLLVRTRATVDGVKDLEQLCDTLGARLHQSVLVVIEAA
jgi:hypothetical protein